MYLDIKYEYLGCGIIHSVNGIENYSKRKMFFYKRVETKKKKRYGW